MFDFAKLSYLPGEHVWRLLCDDEPDEIDVGGTQDGPDAARLALAKLAVASLDGILAMAKVCIGSFVAFDKLGAKGELHAVGLESGRCDSEKLHDLRVLLSLDHDDYGLWEVTIRQQTHPQLAQGFFPVRFSRSQW